MKKISSGFSSRLALEEFFKLRQVELANREQNPGLVSFYTKDKKGGTGLGLAIAHKIVLAHGGLIECRSEVNEEFPRGMVEFRFTLESGTKSEQEHSWTMSSARLIRRAQEVQRIAIHADEFGSNPYAEEEAELERELERRLTNSRCPISVLIVDDEEVYRDGLSHQLTFDSALNSKVMVRTAATPWDAEEQISKGSSVDLIVLDVDLGSPHINGFDLARTSRRIFPESVICIHSNRNLASDHRTALEHGANAFHPKPMIRTHLLKLLIQASEGLPRRQQNTPPSIPGRIAVVDDSTGIQISWELKLGTDNADFFSSPEELFAHASAHSGYLESLICVVSDFHFGNESAETGATFAHAFRKVSQAAFLLSSNEDFRNQDFGDSITRIIPKIPMERGALLKLIHESKESV